MRVGTSEVWGTLDYRQQDHPHACGDKREEWRKQPLKPGSSPCVWGQVFDHFRDLTKMRIIPMRVGTRYRISMLTTPRQDHPHACGDKLPSFVVYSDI